jgi:hypothetical protein
MQARYVVVDAHYQNEGLPPSGVDMAPANPIAVPAPAHINDPARDMRTNFQATPAVPNPEAAHRSDQRDCVSRSILIDPPDPTLEVHTTSAAARSTRRPAMTPSYHASAPRSPTVPPLVNQGLMEKGWEYIAPPDGPLPPLDNGH